MFILPIAVNYVLCWVLTKHEQHLGSRDTGLWCGLTGSSGASVELTALLATLLVFSIFYLAQSETEGERTFGLAALLMSVTCLNAVNSNLYVALNIFILEIAMITALILIQQAYYNAKISNIAPLTIIIAYPTATNPNYYFQEDRFSYFTGSHVQEPGRELQRAVLLPEEGFAAAVLLTLTWASVFLAVFVSSASNSLRLGSVRATTDGVRDGSVLVYKKYTSDSRSKLINPNVSVA